MTEYASDGDLNKYMQEKRNFTEDEAMYYFTMILLALHYLHGKQIIHRDLKPANIYMNKMDSGLHELLVGDFGISKDL